ncbi:MAG: ADP-glyceromanno-heptose 6-epimerase [Selenomonadaceae bacterium]|nr:ADP-glyceromanno-heptose 6-epimerase [Selenomonadaceae bacterium]
MIIVTGGAGFIGSNIVKALNARGVDDVLIVDNLGRGAKYKNLIGLACADVWTKERFFGSLDDDFDRKVDAIIHMGACSDTMEYDVDFMMANNYDCSKAVLKFCRDNDVPLIYASSASTYGMGRNGFRESFECEDALNPYAFSKLMFDRYVRRLQLGTRVVGLRFFNVYGPQEAHKDKMASVFYHMFNQLRADGRIKLFKGIDGVADGEQRRDFVYVNDVVKVCLWFLDHADAPNGIYNCGTGRAHTYNEAARAVINAMGFGEIEYIEFPEILKGKYQNYTQADETKLLNAGYDGGFTELNDAVREYVAALEKNGGYFFD